MRIGLNRRLGKRSCKFAFGGVGDSVLFPLPPSFALGDDKGELLTVVEGGVAIRGVGRGRIIVNRHARRGGG